MLLTHRLFLAGAVLMLAGASLAIAPPVARAAAAGGDPCAAPSEELEFTEAIIDPTRAGGEPIVLTMGDGALLWGSHAGTTHFYGPEAPDADTAAFVQNYRGQTYQYFSEDNGKTWNFIDRPPIPRPELGTIAGLPASGFSDPEFAVDAAGQVYISEINLVNVAVSKSVDGGRTYGVANPFAFTSTDRQWMAADAKDVLYMTGNGFGGGTFPRDVVGTVGHFFAKSTDGGVTWSEAITSNSNGVGDIQIDRSDGTLYEISATAAGDNGTISMAAFRNIRNEDGPAASDFTEPELSTIAEGVGYGPIQRLIDPTFDMDRAGNLYIVWTEDGTGDAGRAAGIWYSYSDDRAKTWAAPIRVDPDERTDIWPWLAVGDEGKVAVTYLATEAELAENNAELAADDDGWNVIVAQTLNGLGCDGSATPGFTRTQASSEPVHYGTICMGGTVCQAELVDRRLGDYFANEIDMQGNTYVSVSNTTAGGSVALPMVIRQIGGPTFGPPVAVDPPDPDPDPDPDPTDDPTDEDPPGGDVGDDDDDRGPSLPATGGGVAVGLGLLLVGSGLILRRRSQH